jgi:hypothetical protein
MCKINLDLLSVPAFSYRLDNKVPIVQHLSGLGQEGFLDLSMVVLIVVNLS